MGERNQVSFLYEENTEDKIFDDFYQAIFGRLGMMGFLNKSITPKVIETSKGYVCNFLQKNTISPNPTLKILGIIYYIIFAF